MENPDDNVDEFQIKRLSQEIDPEFKIDLTLEYLEMRVKRLSQKQLDALYKRLMESDDGNIIIPEIE